MPGVFFKDIWHFSPKSSGLQHSGLQFQSVVDHLSLRKVESEKASAQIA